MPSLDAVRTIIYDVRRDLRGYSCDVEAAQDACDLILDGIECIDDESMAEFVVWAPKGRIFHRRKQPHASRKREESVFSIQSACGYYFPMGSYRQNAGARNMRPCKTCFPDEKES